ncbi:DUF7146 domain-containing protein [Bradyrhizobium japonicum]|uniref:DUF7146 domain-containing protein n=1 Tax=Bradyrhizobium japonicum TaxID=375 RepID=UPI00201034BF|nr:hypothetical protein [Bradyrhizobium japonicum]UQD96075.1 hypothetical protein JEY30_31530 [Bradyrhizobium japonicum]
MNAEQLARALGAVRSGRQWKCKCVAHEDRAPSMIIFDGRERVQVRCLAGCAQEDLIGVLKARGLWESEQTEVRRPAQNRATAQVDKPERDRTEIARWLWSQREPIEGSVVERYMREVRGIQCALPPTLGYLPARGEHLAAMVSAFARAEEIEPGVIMVRPRDVVAVHLTKLTSDAQKIEKIIVGSPRGMPIILAPMNDLLGLVITEGIEEGLSMFEATGCGVWAAGSASLMGGLGDTVPDWTDCVTVLTDVADVKKAGLRGSSTLVGRLLARGVFAEAVASRGSW